MDLNTVNHLIATSQPTNRFWRGPTVAMLGLAMLFGALWANPDLLPIGGALGWLLPQILLIAMIGLMVYRTRRRLRKTERCLAALEAVQLQDWPKAGEILTEVLSTPVLEPPARVQLLMGLAAVADARHEHESSQRICEAILKEGHGDPLQQHTARVALAAAMLRTSQTTDAVRLIDQLAHQDLPGPLEAQVQLLSLFREVTMGHTSDSVSQANERRVISVSYTHLTLPTN